MDVNLDRKTRRRLADNLQAEADSAAIYRALGDLEEDASIADVYGRMADSEERHARFWLHRLGRAPTDLPAPTARARILIWLAKRLGPGAVLPIVAGAESADLKSYMRQPEARESTIPAEERSHHRMVHAILSRSKGGLEGAAVARLEGRHRALSGNALRAGVLGANDGLVSNFSLVMGVAGATAAGGAVLIAGVAGLLAGAFSMALGEWVSVQSARELHQRQLDIEAEELEHHPEEERAELALIYEAKGMPRAEAERLAEQLTRDPETALQTLAREELGIDPEEMGGSAWTAAITSFVLFAAGAVLPILPFLFTGDRAAVIACVAVSAAGLFLIGAAITLLTGRGVWFTGIRQLLLGLAAAAITYGLGTLLGVALG